MEFIQIEVTERPELGTANVRRMRREGKVPGVLYGLARRTLSLTIPGAELERFIRTGSHLVELRMGEETRDAILRDVQQDPLTDEILHVDLQRVDKDAAVEDQVPVQYKGDAVGTKEGGHFQSLLDNLALRARPRDLPRQIILDISGLHVGDSLYIRDVQVEEGVELLHGQDDIVCQVVVLRGRDAEAGEDGEEAVEAPEAEQAEGSQGGEG